MRLRERELDPEVRRRLTAVDASLAGEPVDPELADLAAFATELRDDAPPVDPRFAAELDALVAEGFPTAQPDFGGPVKPPSNRARTRFASLHRRPLLPILAGATTIVIVAGVVAATQFHAGTGDFESGDSLLRKQLSEEPAPPGTADVTESLRRLDAKRGSDKAIVEASATSDAAARVNRPHTAKDRRFEQQAASLTLSADPAQVQDVSGEVRDVAERYDGFVQDSAVSVNGDRARASFSLLVPAANLQAAILDLSDLANVTASDFNTDDVTGSYATAGKRLSAARAEVQKLLRKLEDASSVSEAASLRQQLQIARGELASARGGLRDVKQSVNYAPISLTITGSGDGDGWSIGDAAKDAVDVLEAVGGAILIALAVLVPVGLVGGVIWLAGTRLVRRRRESVLDQD